MEVFVYILNTQSVKDNQSLIVSILDKKRVERANKYVHEQDQLLSLGAGYLAKKLLLNKEIKNTKSGKPYIENGPYFNISHSGELVALAICEDSSVGIDIEKVDEKKINAIKSILCENEKNTENLGDLFKIWSNKESILKCRLEPLIDVRKVSGLPFDGVRELDNRVYYTKSMIYEGYSLSATVEGDKPFKLNIKNVTVSELEK